MKAIISLLKKRWYITLISAPLLLWILLYTIPVTLLNLTIDFGAKKLIKQEKKGLLSKEYGYVWNEINLNRAMQQISRELTSDSTAANTNQKSKSSRINNAYPSLEAVSILLSMDALSNRIEVLDRNGVQLGEIKTTQKLLPLEQFPPLLTETLVLTEDQNFFTRKRAYEPSAFYRAGVMSFVRSVTSFKKVSPRGTSTIHQQVAKFLLSRFNEKGQIYIERSMSRKLREMKLAQALKKFYSNEEILTIYMNHCVTAGKGMVGYHDISQGLFGKAPSNLSEAEQLYLSRLVKWNRQVPEKIITQVKVSLPRIAESRKWNDEKSIQIKEALDRLTFEKKTVINTEHSHLLDLANEEWLQVCRNNGITGDELKEMDISDPGSLIRRKGNLTIQLTIDIRLQKLLEQQVAARGYGNDTTITTDVRIGSYGEDIKYRGELPEDTLRRITILSKDSTVSEPNGAPVTLQSGDTLITNIRYKHKKRGVARRSCYYYTRGKTDVQGQYFSYVMIDAPTGELLAYYSRDRLGSRLNSLIRNRIPNGSALAKPMTYALCYDTEIYEPYAMMADSTEIPDSLNWHRQFYMQNGDTVGMTYLNVKEKEGYSVRNHHRKYEGYDYAFNHLAHSNNIVTVESMFRLNTLMREKRVREDRDQAVVDLMERIGFLEEIEKSGVSRVTGPRLYSELAKRVYSDQNGSDHSIPVSNDNYSYALGTLELSVLEQAHLYNAFYNNRVVENPAAHPSLAIKSITLAGVDFPIEDSVSTFAPFSSVDKIAPVKLAMHKRFTSNGADRMNRFDLCYNDSRREITPVKMPLVNYAKSGTTDDIIRPYNSDPALQEKTNYGIWHGTFRVILPGKELKSQLPKGTSIPGDQVRDITVASVGECNRANTGSPDGKTLHKFLTVALMNRYGETGCTPGYYSAYEARIISETPDEIRYQEEDKPFTLFARTLISADQCHFDSRRRGIRLDRKSRLKLESFSGTIGKDESLYNRLIEDLRRVRNEKKAEKILDRFSEVQPESEITKQELSIAIEALLNSLK